MSASLCLAKPSIAFCLRWAAHRRQYAAVATASLPESVVQIDPSESTRKTRRKTSKTAVPSGSGQRHKGTQKSEDNLSPNLLVESKVQDFLDHIESTKDAITLEDIERHKPNHYPEPHSPQYEHQYNGLVDSLTRSFSQRQFRLFLNLYGIKLPVKRNNRQFAIAIIEQKWKWPSLSQLKRDKIDWTEVDHRDFPMDSRQGFLLMGKDGSNLLNLSKKYNVHLSFTSNPFSLRVEGLKGSLKQFEGYLNNFNSDVNVEATYLPLKCTLSAETTQLISRMSGAYLEFKDDGKLHLTFRRSKPETAVLAKRLAVQAAFDESGNSSRIIHLPEGVSIPIDASPTPNTSQEPSNQAYSLYPFLSSKPLPWKMHSRNAFRLRRVGQWLDSNNATRHTDALACGSGTVMSLEEQNIDIRSHLFNMLRTTSNNSGVQVLAASPGHFLFLSPTSQPATLVPPLRGSLDMSTILQWSKEHENCVTFSPSSPKALMTSPPIEQKAIRRLVYNAKALQEDEHLSSESQRPISVLKTLTLEVTLGESSLPDTPIASCHRGSEAVVDVLMPDRPADIRFSATSIETLSPSHWPEEMHQFFARLSNDDADSNVPLSFTHAGIVYALNSASHVRQTYQRIENDTLPKDCNFLIESIVNPEGKEDHIVCKVVCTDQTSDLEWKTFLQKCDWLTQDVEDRKENQEWSPAGLQFGKDAVFKDSHSWS
ncbi:hypothetical protein B0H34DRAFT_792659 [Crassisporium funariophilum]|nr:hypothetical protein B0H34DRAFT_792659 [Crassisporium funariophilum]